MQLRQEPSRVLAGVRRNSNRKAGVQGEPVRSLLQRNADVAARLAAAESLQGPPDTETTGGSGMTGGRGGTRTPYPEFRRLVLYPDELHARRGHTGMLTEQRSWGWLVGRAA